MTSSAVGTDKEREQNGLMTTIALGSRGSVEVMNE